MKVLKPHKITDAMLVSSTALEIAPAVYSPGTTYAGQAVATVAAGAGLLRIYQSLQPLNTGHAPASSPTWWRWLCDTYQPYSSGASYAAGDRVQDNVAHLVYESVAGGNIGNALADTTKWIKVGATNKWAAFDDSIGTVTETATPLTITLLPGATDGIGFVELQGRQLHVVGKTGTGGTVIYDRTVSLDATPIESFFDWFFMDFEQLGDLVLSDLPAQYNTMELTVTITSTVGPCGAGVCKPGRMAEIGRTKQGARVGILDFSKKTRDDFGNFSVIERSYSKRATFEALTEKNSFNRIFRMLASLRATPCFYIGTDGPGYEPLLVYGFYRDFSIAVEYRNYHLCSLETEGLI
jgi:hypothetical protein